MGKEATRSYSNALRKEGDHMQVQNNWMTLITHYFPSDIGHGEVTQPLASLRVYAHKGQVRTHVRNPACLAALLHLVSKSQKAALKSEA